MGNIALLFFCLAAGMALRATGRVPDNAHLTINGFIINISLPALTLLQIHGVQLQADLLFPVLMPWLMFAGVGTSIWLVGRRLGLAAATVGALILTAGLDNALMIDSGVPMSSSADRSAWHLFVLSTLGIAVACLCSRGSTSISEVARRVVTFPPLIALVLALLLAPAAILPSSATYWHGSARHWRRLRWYRSVCSFVSACCAAGSSR